MSRTLLSLAAASLLAVLQAAPAHAQASRTWVSGVGDDANPCSRTAPCKTFAGAISKTALNGEINCLDPGGFGAVTITKSITVDCHEVFASILNSGTNGINIPFNSFSAADVRRTVRLRNINLNGVDTGVVGIRITGGDTIAGGTVLIEDCLIDGNFAGAARGISDERIGGGRLFVSNTTVRNVGQVGIIIVPASGSTRLDATLDNVRVQNSAFGVAVAGSNRVIINRSVFSGHTGGAVFASNTAEVNLSNSVTNNSGIGIQNGGGAPVIRLSNHRQCVHNTYHGLYKVMTGKYFSINVVRWGNLPIFMQVANAKIADGMFYQSMTVLGIIMLHQVQRISQKQDEVLIEVDWYTASHWLFRWLHGPFNRRLLRLQKKQDVEDNIEIRGRRRDLRHRGFGFATDDPDFINSNRLTDNVRLPPLTAPVRIQLSDYPIGSVHRVVQGPIELLLRRKSGDQVEVWPSLCPHEGGLMDERHLCDGQVVCPWHGRCFSAVLLGRGARDSWRYLSVTVRHKGDHLEVAESLSGDAPASSPPLTVSAGE